LLFVDVLQMEDNGDGGLVRVLHIDRLGPERQPPDDMPTVRHAMADYIGRFEPKIRDGVSKLWRRWPVDLVVQQVPAPPSEDSETGWEPLQVTGADLYGAPEDDENIDHFAEVEPTPLTWRGALYVIEALMRDFSEDKYARKLGGLAKVPEWEPGWLAKAIANSEATRVQHVAELAEATTKMQQRSPELSPKGRAMLEDDLRDKRYLTSAAERSLADLARFSRPASEDALAAEIARVGEAHLSWVETQRSELKRMHRHILTQDLDALMGDESWAAMKAK